MIIKVEIFGEPRVLALLDRTAKGLIDLRVPLGEAGKYLKEYFAGAAYVSRGGVYGDRWPALNEAYAKRKAKKWGDKPMLIASGTMQKNYKYKSAPNYVRIWNPTRWFPYHQSTEARKRLPRRATMGVNETNEREVNRILQDHIQKQVIQKALAA